MKTLDSIQTLEECRAFFENNHQHIFLDDESKNNWKIKVKKLTPIAHKLKEFTNEFLK